MFSNNIIDIRQKKLIIGLLSAILLYSVHPLFAIVAMLISFQFTRSHIRLDPCGVILIMSLLLYTYVGCSTKHITTTNAIWCTLPAVLSYFLGMKIGRDYSSFPILTILYVIFFGLALPHICVTLIDIIENGLVNPERTLSVFSDDEQQRAVTGRTMELSLAIGGFSMLFMRNGNVAQKKISGLFVLLAIVAELCTLHYLSRTGIALLIISIFIGVVSQKELSYKTVLFFLIIIVFYYLLSDSQLFDLFRDREQAGSSIADAGGRTERWIVGFTMLLSNTKGYTIEDFYAHNFWLDYGRDGGLYAAILLSIFSIIILIKSFLLRKRSKINPYLSYCVMVSSVVAFAALFTEPVHVGAPIFMHMYFLLSGIVVTLSKTRNVC